MYPTPLAQVDEDTLDTWAARATEGSLHPLVLRLTVELGFQHIVMMNSDTIPAFPEEFDFDRYVDPVRMTDASDDGGLFGFKFD